MRLRTISAAVLAFGLAVTTSAPVEAAAGGRTAGQRPDAAAYPDTIRLPNGFQPEGIATGPGPFAYVGSMADGSVYRADLRTGHGALLSRGPGTQALGLKTDRHGRLFVAGGTGGDARVLDTRTGRTLATYRLATGPAFVNDVILTQGAAWFTDSTNPVLYKLPLRDGQLPTAAVRIPLTGDLVYRTGPDSAAFNANGITPTPDGRGLIVVQSNTGGLFRVDPATGTTRRVNLHGESLPEGDGLLLHGRTLFAVQNRFNTVAVLRLNAEGTDGHVIQRITDPRFDLPTTIAAFGSRLYLSNIRFFATGPTPDVSYNAVAIPRR
ncbi:superoxide dismutase [Actinomadura syzygii]|uniref:Superoxide dismutase n=1 Tax=Actinomadura syzygii TaxID=1427538 RepID=A0A5D0TT72_9ACTN|nr:superoxide dismutase [Actinomadura syzygii]TYC08904.1 superoxide dismutase [Actinomadura syzygii]